MYQLEGNAGKGHKRPRISPPEDRNSEARSSALERPISNWTTHVAPSVSQLNISKSSISSQSSVEASNAKKPDVEIPRRAVNIWLGDHEDPHEECPGGPCHQAGGGAPIQQINTRACVSTDRENESHPEGWKLPEIQTENANTELCQGGPCHQSGGGAPLKQINTWASVLRKKKPAKPQSVMNLAWLSYWWKRMEREAVRDNTMMKEKKESSKFINFFDRKSKLSDAPQIGSVESIVNGDVLNGRHSESNELKEHHPTTVLSTGQGLLLRGSKRHVPGEISSPAKRMKQLNEYIEKDDPVGSQRTDANNGMATNIETNNQQSEICRPGSSSTEFRSEINTKVGDDMKLMVPYKPGEVES